MGDSHANRTDGRPGMQQGVRRYRSRRTLGLVLAACWAGCTAAGPAAAQQAVDLELLLALDTSGSVDVREFALQRQGLADAFRAPEVVAAIAAYAPSGVAVGVLEWSGRWQQIMAVDWTLVQDAASAAALGMAIGRVERGVLGETAIASALTFAIDELESNRFIGTRRVIDVSGDGVNNSGSAPDSMRDAAVALGITINGLAIVNETPVLDLYYAEHVIGGPAAFALVAKDYEDFAHGMRRKLLREIQGAGLVATDPGEVMFAGSP